MKYLSDVIFERLVVVVAAPRGGCEHDHVIIGGNDVVDVELGERDLHGPGEEAQDTLAAAVVARQQVVTRVVPHDGLVQMLVQPHHVPGDERLVSPSNEFCVFLCRHDASSWLLAGCWPDPAKTTADRPFTRCPGPRSDRRRGWSATLHPPCRARRASPGGPRR